MGSHDLEQCQAGIVMSPAIINLSLESHQKIVHGYLRGPSSKGAQGGRVLTRYDLVGPVHSRRNWTGEGLWRVSVVLRPSRRLKKFQPRSLQHDLRWLRDSTARRQHLPRL